MQCKSTLCWYSSYFAIIGKMMMQICMKSQNYQKRALSRFAIKINYAVRYKFDGVYIQVRKSSTSQDNVEVGSLERLLRVKPAIEFDDEEEIDSEGILEDEMMEEGQSDPREKLARSLLKLSRVHYRHGEDYPEWFVSNQREICSNRTTAQVRRCLKDWMVVMRLHSLILHYYIHM